MHRLNSFKVSEPSDGSGMPTIHINGRKLHLVAYSKNVFTSNASSKMITSWEVAGYLEPSTREEDSLRHDFGDGSVDRRLEMRVFIFNTFTNDGWETTNNGGMKEAALLRWSESDIPADEMFHTISTEMVGPID